MSFRNTRWTILGSTDGITTKRKVLCRCDCGTEREVSYGSLLNGGTLSCGCLRDEITSAASTTHGMAQSREYQSWSHLRRRCNNPNDAQYKNYGGRGIKVCKRWDNSFENFIADMGRAPEGTTIDRINNEGNYEPSNCRWATASQQANNKRNNKFITIDGITLTYAQWEKRSGLRRGVVSERIKAGWSPVNAATKPACECGNMMTYKGMRLSMQAMAAHTGINYGTLKSRIRSGWGIEKAIDTPTGVQQSEAMRIEYEGKKLTLRQWSEIKGIPAEVLRKRISRGMDYAKVFSAPVKDMGLPEKLVTFNGMTLPIKEWAKRTKITYRAIAQRLQRGWTVERALTTPARGM